MIDTPKYQHFLSLTILTCALICIVNCIDPDVLLQTLTNETPQTKGSNLHATRSNIPDLSFYWYVQVNSDNIEVTVTFGGGNNADNSAGAVIPIGDNSRYSMNRGRNNPAIYVDGQLQTFWSYDNRSFHVVYYGAMVRPNVNNIYSQSEGIIVFSRLLLCYRCLYMHPVPLRKIIGSTISGTRSNTPDMTFRWNAEINDGNLNVIVLFGGGNNADNRAGAVIPIGDNARHSLDHGQDNSALYLDGPVQAFWDRGNTSFFVVYYGAMVRPNVNNVYSHVPSSPAGVIVCAGGWMAN